MSYVLSYVKGKVHSLSVLGLRPSQWMLSGVSLSSHCRLGPNPRSTPSFCHRVLTPKDGAQPVAILHIGLCFLQGAHPPTPGLSLSQGPTPSTWCRVDQVSSSSVPLLCHAQNTYSACLAQPSQLVSEPIEGMCVLHPLWVHWVHRFVFGLTRMRGCFGVAASPLHRGCLRRLVTLQRPKAHKKSGLRLWMHWFLAPRGGPPKLETMQASELFQLEAHKAGKLLARY